MFEAYDLPEGAPHKRVWYCLCDSESCDRFLGPFSTWQKSDQRGVVEREGWAYGEGVSGDACWECVGGVE